MAGNQYLRVTKKNPMASNYIPLYSDEGIELTEDERKLIASLQRFAKKWEKHGGRLSLFGHCGNLSVIMKENKDDRICGVKGIHAIGDEFL